MNDQYIDTVVSQAIEASIAGETPAEKFVDALVLLARRNQLDVVLNYVAQVSAQIDKMLDTDQG